MNYRSSLVDAVKNRDLGERVHFDNYQDDFSSSTSFVVYKTYYKRLKKQLIPTISNKLSELEKKGQKLKRINIEKIKSKVTSQRASIVKHLHVLAKQKEREFFMNQKYLKVWKQIVDIVPKFDEELPTGGPILGSLAVARGLLLIKGFIILDASLMIRKGGTCRHGRNCCNNGHFVNDEPGVDLADLYLRKLHEESSFDEGKLDMMTLKLDHFGATLQRIDQSALNVMIESLDVLKQLISDKAKKIDNFDSLSSIQPVKKNKRILLLDDDDDDDDDDDEDSQNVENEHILFENNDAVTEDILTSSTSTTTTSTTTSSSSNFDLNNDYDQFQLNFPEAGVNQGRIDGSISTSAYQMQRDDVSNREGTISIAEMMCTKSKSWEGNATSSMKGYGSISISTSSTSSKNNNSKPNNNNNNNNKSKTERKASNRRNKKQFMQQFYVKKKRRKPLIFLDKNYLKRMKKDAFDKNEDMIGIDENNERKKYHARNILLEWYERDQKPFLELGEMAQQRQSQEEEGY